MSRARKFLGFWMVFILFVFVYPGLYFLLDRAVDTALDLPQLRWTNANLFLSVVSLGLGIFWVTWAYSYIHFAGKGSPVEAFGVALYPTQYLITSGPYAYTRNPMVLGLLFILLTVALAIGSISGLIMIPIFAFLLVLYIREFEEPQLARRFGSAYTEYRRSVPELIPRFPPSPLAR